MNLKNIALGFGVILVLVGLSGYIKPLAPNGMLLGLFMIDPLHNLVHITTGVLAIVAALMGIRYTKLFFQIFGLVYALVTISGFVTGHALFVLMPVNMADNLLHIAISAISLYFGFVYKEKA